ncbi:UNVERIFIED_CONTAM: hypothetical protein HDU68_010948 [Siphonaria sp. JEL0065]|nr:hypothetical protein HDU68_010948 [Siphonaria sp. JEL0065]
MFHFRFHYVDAPRAAATYSVPFKPDSQTTIKQLRETIHAADTSILPTNLQKYTANALIVRPTLAVQKNELDEELKDLDVYADVVKRWSNSVESPWSVYIRWHTEPLPEDQVYVSKHNFPVVGKEDLTEEEMDDIEQQLGFDPFNR